jgi:hypothetical protein
MRSATGILVGWELLEEKQCAVLSALSGPFELEGTLKDRYIYPLNRKNRTGQNIRLGGVVFIGDMVSPGSCTKLEGAPQSAKILR